jgi:hypothetical protein
MAWFVLSRLVGFRSRSMPGRLGHARAQEVDGTLRASSQRPGSEKLMALIKQIATLLDTKQEAAD